MLLVGLILGGVWATASTGVPITTNEALNPIVRYVHAQLRMDEYRLDLTQPNMLRMTLPDGDHVRTPLPLDSLTTRALRTALRVRPKRTVVLSPLQSPFGVTACGDAFRPLILSGGGPGTGKVDGLTLGPALMVYV